ncbi:MAG: MFS transporter [Chloroflexi bacterium]|nr:MFS transporter [Chloroflexota bacterium]
MTTASTTANLATGAADRKHRLRWWTLSVLSLSLVLIGMDNTILNVAIPTLQREFSVTSSTLQWMVDSYLLVFAGLLLTMGGLGDRFGRAQMLRAGLVIFAIAAFVVIFAESSSQVIAARAVMGIGGAMIMPATLSIIIDVFKGPERARAISIWAATAGVGVGLGPLIGGALLEQFYWGSVFLVNVPIAAVALIAGFWLVPDSRDPEAKPVDFVGAGLSTAAVALFIYAIIEAPSEGWTAPITLAGFGISIALAAAFSWWELRVEYPLLNFAFFKRMRFSMGAGAISLAFFALMGMIFAFTQYLQFVRGYTALEAGIRLLPLAAGIAVGARGGEMINRRFGTKVVVGTGLILLAGTLSIITIYDAETPLWLIEVSIFLTSVAMGSIMAPSTDSVMGAVPPEHAGVGSAMNDVTRQVGGAFGIAIIGSVLTSIYSSRVAGAVDAVSGLSAAAAASAKDSVGAATGIAAGLPPQIGEPLANAARDAYSDAFGLAVLVGVAFALIGAALVFKFMPAREQPIDPVPARATMSAHAGPAEQTGQV